MVWENAGDENLLRRAREEILASTDGNPPPILDPFAGGGTIPLEAQRLGLEAHASDLNPVAVLINKALIEIPPKFAGRPPVFPGAADAQINTWPRATGLAEDVRRYGQWMRDEAEKRIGHLYPKAELPDGTEATVIAWIWARTVTCPNPACGIAMPLVRSWWLGKKKGKEAYVVPSVVDGKVEFSIGHDPKKGPTKDTDGTVGRTGAVCIGCGAAVEREHIKAEGRAGRMGAQLMATVAEGRRTRIYLDPTPEHELAAQVERPIDVPDQELGYHPKDIWTPPYGLTTFADLFTSRQLTALITFSDLVGDARERVLANALAAGVPEGGRLEAGGTGAAAYADAVATYLGLGVSRFTNYQASLCRWRPDAGKEQVGDFFARQAIPMTWDFADANCFSNSAGGWGPAFKFIPKCLDYLQPAAATATAVHASATNRAFTGHVISTDPPYYDNIGYSDLSDFFYVWLRRSLRSIHPELMGSMLVPKAEELVANPYRHEGKDGAHHFFEKGFREVFRRARQSALLDFPITVYYAFKQQDANDNGEASTGWETLLEGMIHSGWAITATWPMRSELGNRMLSQGTNALASSIVLALRPRTESASTVDRRGFINALKDELPQALRELQQGAIAPVDLPQAAIGPGMAVFSRYVGVLNDDGSKMTVRAALARINEILDEVLVEQEGDFDSDTRFAIAWFRQHGFDAGKFGDADNMARARNASLEHLERSGILTSRAGKVALLSPAALGEMYAVRDYDPGSDPHISTWEVVMHLSHALSEKGVPAAAALLSRVPESIDRDLCKELSFLLFTIAEDLKRTQVAIEFNSLGTAWNDIVAESRTASTQLTLDT
ncbi:adenine-specific DNA methylase [Rhodococcus aetherivorans]|uniref:Adenine-specific DNA methylase n=1 Tax=Rhodococcus aetherivorans TaxID=191292 RepID=A0ABQ0YF83_9NOCA|nr:Adenine-specific DNA methylase containing a Zn-ribbon-like protein [Rhodococcus rhodochrous ATCC 21198]GES35196.1 adenine-specific DNA methylase [Rhodococcus aetherivorans]